jgi:hypothetical protein
MNTEEELKKRHVEKWEAARLVREADPLLQELSATMAILIPQIVSEYQKYTPESQLMVVHRDRQPPTGLSIREALDVAIYEATTLRKAEEPGFSVKILFDTRILEEAVTTLCTIFGDRGMTRKLALSQIVSDLITEQRRVY